MEKSETVKEYTTQNLKISWINYDYRDQMFIKLKQYKN